MTETDIIVGQLLGSIEERATGIFRKQLDNGREVYSCKCTCGTIHGGYRTYAEAETHKKCRMCYRKEIERTRKDIEKVDEPKKQKNIFQHSLKKPTVIGENEEDDFEGGDWKEVSEVEPDHLMYLADRGRETYVVSRDGLIGRQGYKMQQLSDDWKMKGMSFHHWARSFVPWTTLRARLDNGETLYGYVFDVDHGTTRSWGDKARVYKASFGQFQENEEDFGEENWISDVEDADTVAYTISSFGGERFPVSTSGMIGEPGAGIEGMSRFWTIDGMVLLFSHDFVSWPELKAKLDAGQDMTGHVVEKKRGKRGPTSTRKWNTCSRIYRPNVNEAEQEDLDIQAVVNGRDTLPGDVTKVVCEKAALGQDFWHRFQKHADGTPIRVRANGWCQTWESKPNEFRLPVRYGLFQTFYITEHNADDFTTVAPGVP